MLPGKIVVENYWKCLLQTWFFVTLWYGVVNYYWENFGQDMTCDWQEVAMVVRNVETKIVWSFFFEDFQKSLEIYQKPVWLYNWKCKRGITDKRSNIFLTEGYPCDMSKFEGAATLFHSCWCNTYVKQVFHKGSVVQTAFSWWMMIQALTQAGSRAGPIGHHW